MNTPAPPPPAPSSPPPPRAAQPPAGAACGQPPGEHARPTPAGTAAFFDAVRDVLARGALTPFGIERAIEREWPLFLAGRRGYVHAALLHLRRRGAVVAARRHTLHGSRRVFALPGAAPDDGPRCGPDDGQGTSSAQPGDVPAPIAKLAARVTRGLRFAPALREDLRRDVAEHLLDAATTLREAGTSDRAAVREAISEFGDPWRVRTDLARIATGRRVVLFPSNLRETLAGLAIYDAGILLCIVAAIVFVRLEVFTAYHIPTRSMEPTLHGDRRDGDRILVSRLAPPPEPFDIYVFDGWGAERKNYVKRCVGVPNQTLRLREGDVYVDGELVRKSGDVYEALLFPLYGWDDVWARARSENEGDAQAAADQVFDEQLEFWENVSGKWMLDVSRGYHALAPAQGQRSILRWRDSVRDDLYDPLTGDVVGGNYACPDVRVSADVELLDDSSEVVLHLSRGASTYEAVVSSGRIELLVEGEPVAKLDAAPVAVGETVRVRFSQVDRVLRLDVGDVQMRHELPQPEFPKRTAPSGQVDFRARGGGAWIKPLALERDIFYTPDYDTDEVVLGPDDFYMLGDNSGNSQDSRRNGPVHRSRLIGRPILVVWPPRRWHIPR